MKSKIVAFTLLAFTALAVGFYPALHSAATGTQMTVAPPPVVPIANDEPRVEVVFVLDTTGSMGGLIQAAKEKIWSIASTMAAAQPAPEIRMGLVAYRDRGDAYVTRAVDLSSDLDSVYATLLDLQAQGGGDGPESVNQALHEAVEDLSWSSGQDTYRVVFLVGDAPPHMDYQDDVKWPVTVARAREKGVRVNAIQCGTTGGTTVAWQRIALAGAGSYFQVEQAGGAVAIVTPYDERLAAVSSKMDQTRLYYGSDREKAQKQRKLDAGARLNELASVASRARRAAFNASASGEANFLGGKELVEDVVSGRVDLDDVAPDALPAPVRALPAAEQKALIQEKAERRAALKKELQALSEDRAAYLRAKVDEAGGAEDSLDHGIYRAVREQAAAAGLHYEAEAPAY